MGFTLGWQDIRQSYRRSALGQFWITLGMAVSIAAIGLVFGTIFGSPLQEFLPYLASGIIMWGLLSGILSDGTSAFISAEGMIKQIPIPKLVHLIRVVWRNIIVTAHNILIFPVAVLVVGGELSWISLLWPVGLVVGVISISGLALVLSIFATRFRDIPPIVSAVLTIAFYVTPVIWNPEDLGNNELAHLLLGLNPFYHLLQVARLPLLGQFPTVENWGLALLSAGVFWAVGLAIFQKYQHRIAYWV